MKIEIDAVLKELEYAKNMEFEHRHYTAIQNAMKLITELKRLATIGRYTEMAFNDGADLVINPVWQNYAPNVVELESYDDMLDSIELLLEWGNEQTE